MFLTFSNGVHDLKQGRSFVVVFIPSNARLNCVIKDLCFIMISTFTTEHVKRFPCTKKYLVNKQPKFKIPSQIL